MGCTAAKASEPEPTVRLADIACLPEPSRTGRPPTLIARPNLFGPETKLKNGMMTMQSAAAEHVEFDALELDFLQQGVLAFLEGIANPGSYVRHAYTKVDIENLTRDRKTKPSKVEGYTQNLTEGKFAIACLKGTRKGIPNQDSWTVLECGEEFSIFVVCDGNGNDGHVFSNQACDLLVKYLFRSTKFKDNFQSFKSCITEAFVNTNDMLGKLSRQDGKDIEHSGTTATVVMYKRQSKCLWLAYVGDCGVVSINQAGTARLLTEDHRPEVEEEARRIEEAGGKIKHDGYSNYRIYDGAPDAWQPGSKVSRMLGNMYGQRLCGMTCLPTVKQIQLSSLDHVVTVASDGVWTFVKPEEVVSFCPPDRQDVPLQKAVDDLADLAWRAWEEKDEHSCVDDITAIMFKPGVKTE